MEKLRDTMGMFLLSLGAIGCLLPIIPGIPFLLGAVALLGPDHPRLKPWVNRIPRWQALIRKAQRHEPTKTNSEFMQSNIEN